MALVLRDQKMLEQLDKVSKKTKYILRNGLTLKYPAVPLVNGALDSEDSSSLTSRTVTDDEEDTPWEVRKCPPGKLQVLCVHFFLVFEFQDCRPVFVKNFSKLVVMWPA